MANPVRAGARRVPPVLSVALATVCAVVPAMAQQAPPPPEGGLSLDVEVIAKQLDIARQQIVPGLGATVYDFTRPTIETQPQGDNQSLNQLLLQAPGVAQDSFGQVHVRGDHANLQFRINGVQLPEGVNVFGQSLETRFANSVALITGALPAQYGLRTAGIIDIRPRPGRSTRAARSRYMAASSRGFSRASNSAVSSAKSITTRPANFCTTRSASRPRPTAKTRSTTSATSRAASPMSPASSTRTRD